MNPQIPIIISFKMIKAMAEDITTTTISLINPGVIIKKAINTIIIEIIMKMRLLIRKKLVNL